MSNNRYIKTVNEIKAPERAVEKMLETARNIEKKEKVINMKKWIKGAVAASLAIAAAAGSVIGFNLSGGEKNNDFVLKVGAAELNGENSVKIGINEYKGFCLSEGDDSIAAYSIDMPVVCEGKDIDTVTYSVDSGTLTVSSRKDNSPVVYGTKLNENKSFPGSVNLTEEDRKAVNAIVDKESEDEPNDELINSENAIYASYTQEAYSSVTFAYDNQNPEGSSFCFAGFAEDLDKADYSYLKAHKDELYNLYGDEALLEKQKECLNLLIGRTVHCTVRFKDGTEQTNDIKIGAAVSTYSSEFPDEYEALPDDVKSQKDYKGVFVTYTVAN